MKKKKKWFFPLSLQCPGKKEKEVDEKRGFEIVEKGSSSYLFTSVAAVCPLFPSSKKGTQTQTTFFLFFLQASTEGTRSRRIGDRGATAWKERRNVTFGDDGILTLTERTTTTRSMRMMIQYFFFAGRYPHSRKNGEKSRNKQSMCDEK